jgi:hypothetical protein
MTITPEWANVFLGVCGLAITIVGLLLNSIRLLLAGIRGDIAKVMERQNAAETRLSVVEEIVKRLKCQRCDADG